MKINKIIGGKRVDLAIMFDTLGFKRGAEIGVRTGKFSEVLCTHIKGLEKLYAIDPWDLVLEDPISKAFQRKYTSTVFGKIYKLAQRRLDKYPMCEMIKKTSLVAVKDFEYLSLDFVYIDGAHTFDYVMTDIIEWSRRVKKGGIIAGDDYQKLRTGNVVAAVNAYVQAHNIAVLNIIEPLKNDEYPSPNWWFVKQ